MPYVTIFAFYVLSFHILSTNSRTSTLWKLNSDENKIVEASPFHQVVTLPGGISDGQFVTEDDPIFNIITSTVHFGQSWTKQSVEYYCTDCQNLQATSNSLTNKYGIKNVTELSDQLTPHSHATSSDTEEVLDCGKAVNFTYYDNLVGVANRHRHPNVPEPQVALIFSKKKSTKGATSSDFDVNALERRLKKAKREKPKSVSLYNQIGNFWRIKGDAHKSIECFRRALAVSPHNAEVLLNLARVLFTLQYLDDAIYLTRRSLEVQPPDKSAWQQYFTLGEIFKAYGHYQEASLHLRHTLELRPDFEPALAALRDMEAIPEATIHVYTLLIIICLVLGVLLVILSSVDSNLDTDFTTTPATSTADAKPQRHFNRAMAMRSLRGIAPRSLRSKKGSAAPGST
ncbi:super sex combs [Carabus blaptoides fortunei]